MQVFDVKRIRTNLTQLHKQLKMIQNFFFTQKTPIYKSVAEKTQCLIGNISLTTSFIQNFLCLIDSLYNAANQQSMAK